MTWCCKLLLLQNTVNSRSLHLQYFSGATVAQVSLCIVTSHRTQWSCQASASACLLKLTLITVASFLFDLRAVVPQCSEPIMMKCKTSESSASVAAIIKKSFVVGKKQLCGKLVKAVLVIHLCQVLLAGGGGWGGWCTVEIILFFPIVRSDVRKHCNQTLYGSAYYHGWGWGGGVHTGNISCYFLGWCTAYVCFSDFLYADTTASGFLPPPIKQLFTSETGTGGAQ